MTEEKESLRSSAGSMADLCLRQSRMNSPVPKSLQFIAQGCVSLLLPKPRLLQTQCHSSTDLSPAGNCSESWSHDLSSWKPVLCYRERFGKKKECFWSGGHCKTDFIKYNERGRLEREGKDWVASTQQQWLLSSNKDEFTKFTCNRDVGLVRM